MANQPSDGEVFDFSNTEFTREDLINALNEVVHEYRKLSQTFEEVNAENNSLKNSSVEPSTAQLGETDSFQTELSKLKSENESLRLRSCELESENERLNLVMSSWTQSSVSLSKLHETQKPLNDKSGLGFNGEESSAGETCTQSNLIIYLSGVLSFYLLSTMASSVIANALQVNFDSVLGIPNNDGMVKMFRDLESTGLRGFLGCPSFLYEKELEQFFDNALVKDNEVLCVIHDKVVVITEERFAGVFELPTALTDLSKLKYEFRFLNDILAKSVMVKAGSFDAVTHERFVLMTAIHFELKVNWSKLLFDILKEMADRSSKRSKGYAAQICVLLKGDPAVTLEEAKTFPPLKILSAKTDIDEVQMEIVAKKRPAAASDAPAVKKKRTVTGTAAPAEKDLALRKAPQRKLRLSTGSDDEIVEQEPDVEHVEETQKEQTTVDDVDKIIDQCITETVQMETDLVEPDIAERVVMGTDLAEPVLTRSDDRVVKISERSFAVYDEDDDISGVEQPSKIINTEADSVKNKETDIPLVETETGKEIDLALVADVGHIPLDEESLSIDELLKRIPEDMMLPSVTASEPVKIKFGHGISITGVADGDWHKASLPKIALREKVIDEVAAFFNSFSLRRLAVLKSLKDIAAKEEIVLTWALVPVGPVLGDRSIPRRIVDNISYRIQIVDSISLSSTDLGITDSVVQVDADLSTNPVFADPVVQENYNNLTSQVSELVDYINRGGDAKKGQRGSSRGPQHPPDDRDRSRPGGGGGSRNLSLGRPLSSKAPRRRRPPPKRRRPPPRHVDRTCSDHRFEEFPSVLISSGLLVQADKGTLLPVVDLIDDLQPPTDKSQFPCDSGWSQAPRRQQGNTPKIIL
ncbi:hypothetical protein F511_17759 [Dorcoceras hygrometricum]|uniref:Splicing factor 3B subunit 1-like n=1 Tax=Dorcoceras hygrometricum TaxID=472368 RepID=A0A2Z7BG84_9LAMI|nr:hypothetical protein F511_17759 [Dorcoceras hygrometricum]